MDQPVESFSAKEVSKLLQISPAHVAQVGQIIEPEIAARGRGRRNLYSFSNIIEIAIFDVLTKFGVPRKFIKNHIEGIRRAKYRWLEEDGKSGWISLADDWRWAAGESPNHSIEGLVPSGFPMAIVSIDVISMKLSLRDRINQEFHKQ